MIPEKNSKYRHIVNREVYTISDIAIFQCSADKDFDKLLMVVYRDKDGVLHARLLFEFLGKFEVING